MIIQTPEKDKDFTKQFHYHIDDGTWAKWSPKAQAVYPVILRHAGYTSRKAILSIETIANESGVTSDSVQAGIKEIIASGYVSKRRGGAGIKFMNIYTMHKEKSLKSVVDNITRKKTVKRKAKRNLITGKFVATAKNTVDCSRVNTVTDTSRENHGKKESLETLNRDNAGSSSAFQGQASPVSPMLKSYIGKTIDSPATLSVIVSVGGAEAIRLIRNGEIMLSKGVNFDNAINAGKSDPVQVP